MTPADFTGAGNAIRGIPAPRGFTDSSGPGFRSADPAGETGRPRRRSDDRESGGARREALRRGRPTERGRDPRAWVGGVPAAAVDLTGAGNAIRGNPAPRGSTDSSGPCFRSAVPAGETGHPRGRPDSREFAEATSAPPEADATPNKDAVPGRDMEALT